MEHAEHRRQHAGPEHGGGPERPGASAAPHRQSMHAHAGY